MVKVLSVGGSIVAPDAPDTDFLKEFVKLIREWLSVDLSRKLILVCGGGGPARTYQTAFKSIASDLYNKDADQADWIGIMATRLNAQLLKAIFADICEQDVIYDPTIDIEFTGRILIAAGWKPGFSTDNDAVLLAERFAAKTVLNLSNIEKVYTADPKLDPSAQAIDTISWKDFRKMVGDEWVPGKNTPFDPIASKRAEHAGISVVCAGGRNIENIRCILDDKPFIGTTIS